MTPLVSIAVEKQQSVFKAFFKNSIDSVLAVLTFYCSAFLQME